MVVGQIRHRITIGRIFLKNKQQEERDEKIFSEFWFALFAVHS